jgi:hypothetical protein
MTAYGSAIDSERFLQALERTEIQTTPNWVRSAYHGYIREERIYIPLQTLQNELSISPPRQTIEINDSTLTDSRRISEKKIRACFHSGVIYVDNLP